MAEQIEFELVSPERLLLARPVEMVVVPGAEGDFGALPGHAPFVSILRPGVIAVSHHFGHWELASRPHAVDGVAQSYDRSRGTGLTVNPIMRLDQFKGKVLNTSIQDKVGGSVSFYDSRVKLVKA